MSIKDKIAEAKTVDMFSDIPWWYKKLSSFHAKITVLWLRIRYWAQKVAKEAVK